MGERTEKVKEYISAYEKELQNLSKENSVKNETQELNNLIVENDKIQVELNKLNLRAERLKEELSEVNPRDIELVDEYKKKIAEIENSEERQSLLEKQEENKDKQKEAQVAIDIKKRERKEKMKAGAGKIEDELRRTLTMEKAEIDKKIEYMKIKIQKNSYDLKYFKYEYEEVGENGVRVPTNGHEYAKLLETNEKYQKELEDLEDAKKMCDDKLQELKDIADKRVEKINDILKRENQHKAKEDQRNNEENPSIIPESSKDESKQQGNETTKSNEPSDKPEIELNESKSETEIEPNNNEIANEQEGFNVLRDPSEEEAKEQGDKIIDDLGKDYKNLKFSFKLETDDKKDISIFISENNKVIKCKDKDGVMTNIPMDALKDENKNMFKRLDISKKCRKIKKEIKGKRLAGLTLKRKLNPEIIRALDRTENRDLIEKYIESVYTKSEFPFELKHDLSGLKRREKLALRKYTKTEEKCGAQILGKIWNKNKALGEGKKDVNKLEQESKAEVAANVEKMMKDEKSKKDKTPWVQKVDGKNAEIAKKYAKKTENEPVKKEAQEIEDTSR